jgi:hypothetical protein
MEDDVSRVARGLPRSAQKAVLGLADAKHGDVIVQRDARAALTAKKIAEPFGAAGRFRLTDYGLLVARALRS